MSVTVEKIPGGFRIDGLSLMGIKCGCTAVLPCCHSWSKVKKKSGGKLFEFSAKTSTPDTQDNFKWSYEVEKEGITIKVDVEDARDKKIFSGYLPPSVTQWEEKGWNVIEKSGDREDGILWRCSMCRWLYKEDKEETPFEELPDDWKCPRCSATKKDFEKIE